MFRLSERNHPERLIKTNQRTSFCYSLYDPREAIGIWSSYLRECFAVQINSILRQIVNNSTVRNSILSCCCIDPSNPQTTHFSFSITSIRIGRSQCFLLLLIRRPKQSRVSPPESGSKFENILAMPPSYGSAFYSGR
jgi:hypothetical protein